VAREHRLTDDPDEVAHVVRILDASVNVRILKALMEERRKGEGWLFLSEIAKRIDEKPGTVGLAIQKLLPLLEEKYEKGKRWFRTPYVELTITLEEETRRKPGGKA
jgi:predicted DNA-binding ArsR family transcriptional regulator